MERSPTIEMARVEDLPDILDLANWAAANTPANFATEPELLEPWLEGWQRTRDLYPWLVARLGADRVVLETGERQGAALALYERSGYVRTPRFGEYVDSPLSICMQKPLGEPQD